MIHCIVVIYNQKCSDSVTCQELEKQESSLFDVTVFDNSVRDYGNRSFCRGRKWNYLGGNGNQGLSKAYNASIMHFRGAPTSDYLCILDDDTKVQNGFFEELQNQVKMNPGVDIFLPILKQNEKIVSPSKESTIKPFFTTEKECLQADRKQITAFNSGMMVKLEVYRDYQYDERIFLDGVDHAFIRDMKIRGKEIKIIPVYAEQSFSGGEKSSLQSAVTRFSIYFRDYRILFENNPIQYWFIVGKRALHLCLLYRTSVFVKMIKGD